MVETEISPESLATLQSLLGRSIPTMFAPRLDASGAHLAGRQISMLLADGSFATFECVWSETQEYLIDSWVITVAKSDQPLGIPIDASGSIVDPCTISVFGAKPIRLITIYQAVDIHDGDKGEEAVKYDGTLVFAGEDGPYFAIGCMLNGPGCAEDLHFSVDAGIIESLIGDSKARLILT